MATSPSALAKSGGKYGDLKRRLLFLLLALVVYRVGAHIPVPGINPDALRGPVPQPAGRRPGHVQHVLRRRAVAVHGVRARDHAVHLGVDHHAAADGGRAAAGGDQEGRRVRPAQHHQVHPLVHAGAGHVPGAVDLDRAGDAGQPGDRPGHDVPLHHGCFAGDRHHVPDVAGRADHRARAWATGSRSSSSPASWRGCRARSAEWANWSATGR